MINLKKKLEQDGYVVVKKFVSRKRIQNIYIQIENLIDIILKNNSIKYNENWGLDKKYLFLKKKNNKLKSKFYDLLKNLESVNSAVFCSKTISLIKKLMSEENILVFGQRIRLDHKRDNHHLPLHQELNNISKDFLNIWIPLVKVNKKSGSLCVIPKSHKFGHVHYEGSNLEAVKHKIGIVKKILSNKEKKYKDKILNKIFVKKNIHFPSLNVGDAIIFKTFTFHGSTPYVGKGIRWTLLSTFHNANKIPYINKNRLKELRIPYNMNYNQL